MVLAVLGVLAATTGEVVLLVTAAGGLSGLAALATVFVTGWANKRKSEVDKKSVAITELEKAVPGLTEIINQWQTVVKQLQTDLDTCRNRVAALEKERDEQ